MKHYQVISIIAAVVCGFVSISADVPVIPGGFGFGITTPAGRGGTVYRVTNLNDAGAGSFRAAVEASGPRVVLFEISGTIRLASRINLSSPYITIAGQTAPSPGITIAGDEIRITTHDVLIQHIRWRTGSNTKDIDAFAIYNPGNSPTYNIVIDHCSASWAIDENVQTWGWEGDRVHDVTFSNMIISEALNNAGHEKGAHSKGLLLGDGHRNLAVIGNLFAHNVDRNPLCKAGVWAVVANNMIYNWLPSRTATGIVGGQNMDPNEPSKVSVVGNVYRRGPNMPLSKIAYAVEFEIDEYVPAAGTQVYIHDQISPNITPYVNEADFLVSTPPIWLTGLTAKPASETQSWVLANAGARPADRDAVDLRIVNEVINQTGRIIDSETQVGGYPVLAVNVRALTLPANPNADDDQDGYTNLEEWLHAFSAEVEKTGNDSFSTGNESSIIQDPVESAKNLLMVYPNPFNPSTTIQLQNPTSHQTNLKIYDMDGRLVWETDLVPPAQSAEWSATDMNHRSLTSGMYLLRGKVGNAVLQRKLILLK